MVGSDISSSVRMFQVWIGYIKLRKDGSIWVEYVKLSKDRSGLGQIYKVELGLIRVGSKKIKLGKDGSGLGQIYQVE